jgi:general secretion pathway protein M
MNSPAALNGLKQSLSTFWSERNQRERNLLIVAIAVVTVGLFYALLIDPAASGRKDLEKRLPAMRQQTAEVQAMAKEVAAVSGKTAPPAPALTREGLEASLVKRGLKPQNVVLTGELAKVQLASASFANTVDWLEEMQRTARVSVVDANIEALPQTDTVNASFTLRQQRNEQNQ